MLRRRFNRTRSRSDAQVAHDRARRRRFQRSRGVQVAKEVDRQQRERMLAFH